MTYEQAVALRAHQLQGLQVDKAALAEAIAIIKTSRPTPTKLRPPPGKKHQAAVEAEPVAAPAPADPWPLLTPQTEAQVLSASRNAWPMLGREE